MTQEEYAKEVCGRRDKAECIPYKEVSLEGWAPQAHRCHENVATWVRAHSHWRPVRGWVVYEESERSYGLTAHSVVQSPDGKLYDITPPNCPGISFIPHRGKDDAFFRRIGEEGGLIHCDKII